MEVQNHEKGEFMIRISFFSLAFFCISLTAFFVSCDNEKVETNKFEWISVKLAAPVDSYSPKLKSEMLPFAIGEITGINLELNDKKVWLPLSITKEGITLGEKELELSSGYVLKVFTESGKRYKVSFMSSGLPSLPDTGERRIIRIPAMPDKGFNWPYFLVLPSNTNKQENLGHKRYIMLDTPNTLFEKRLPRCEEITRTQLEKKYFLAMKLAEDLWTPLVMPVFCRPHVVYLDKDNEENLFYTQAFDRDTATLHLKMQDNIVAKVLRDAFLKEGYEVNEFLHLDDQIASIAEHAKAYLNSEGWQVDAGKIFIAGFSASGTFSDRFSTLHPDKVKAVASGATLDDMILPFAEYKGEKLIFPIGIYDYEKITGKQFDLNVFNNTARLVYMGENDTNNTLIYPDGYGKREQDLIRRLWGEPVLPRAKQLIKLYGEAGGKGVMILDKGIAHADSNDMYEYVLTFFKQNRDSETPVYPDTQKKTLVPFFSR